VTSPAIDDAALPAQIDGPPTAVLESLTDEELAVLSPTESVVVAPYLDAIAPRERTALLRTAYRGLVARGIVEPPTAEARARARTETAQARLTVGGVPGSGSTPRPEPAVGVDVQVREDVASLVTLRRSARAVVAMARTTALLQDYVYLHVVEDVLLVEEVSSDGIHSFILRRSADLAETVLAAAVHPEAGDGIGEPTTVAARAVDDPTPPDAILRQAGLALLRCDLTVLTRGNASPRLLGLFSGPAGSWIVETARGSGAPIVTRPVAADELRGVVRQALGVVGCDA